MRASASLFVRPRSHVARFGQCLGRPMGPWDPIDVWCYPFADCKCAAPVRAHSESRPGGAERRAPASLVGAHAVGSEAGHAEFTMRLDMPEARSPGQLVSFVSGNSSHVPRDVRETTGRWCRGRHRPPTGEERAEFFADVPPALGVAGPDHFTCPLSNLLRCLLR